MAAYSQAPGMTRAGCQPSPSITERPPRSASKQRSKGARLFSALALWPLATGALSSRRRRGSLSPAKGVEWRFGMGDSSAAGSRNVEVYEKVEQVGEGTYG